MSRYEKKLKDKLDDDEIKLAGLEALVPEELEKHLILNSNRLRTFEVARLEIVTYVKAKIGLRIRDSKPGDTGSRRHSEPMDVDAVNSLSSDEGEGHRVRVMGGAHFQRDHNARKSTGKQSSGKGKQSKSWSKSEGIGKRKESEDKTQRFQRCRRFVQGYKTSKIGVSSFENPKLETTSETQESAQTYPTDNSYTDKS